MISCVVYFITFGYLSIYSFTAYYCLAAGQSTRFFYSLSLSFPTYLTVTTQPYKEFKWCTSFWHGRE